MSCAALVHWDSAVAVFPFPLAAAVPVAAPSASRSDPATGGAEGGEGAANSKDGGMRERDDGGHPCEVLSNTLPSGVVCCIRAPGMVAPRQCAGPLAGGVGRALGWEIGTERECS
jgi:hypothetical protein